jgi:uncharacterized protein YbaA (DUF1428 family)
MARYVDFYCLPVPRRNLATYKRLAKTWGRVMKGHGMLAYSEFVEAHVDPAKTVKGTRSINALVDRKRNEVVIFSVASFRSKAHRDRVNDLGWHDPRMKKLMQSRPLFDMKRMTIGEFTTLVAI